MAIDLVSDGQMIEHSRPQVARIEMPDGIFFAVRGGLIMNGMAVEVAVGSVDIEPS